MLGKLGTWSIDNQRQVLLIPSSSSQTLTASVAYQRDYQLYKRGLTDYQERNYEAAVVHFKQFIRLAPQALQAGTAQYLIGESLYAQRQYEAAIVAFDEVVQKHSQDPKVPAAILKQGYAFAELRDARNARFFLQQVQKKYPNSPEAQQATEKLRQLR